MKTTTSVKAGGGGPIGLTHNEIVLAAVRVKTSLKAGTVPDGPE